MGKSGLVLDPGKRTVLCIGAHPDDCEFRCSGTAALFAKAGDRVIFLSMTDGSSGHQIMKAGEIVERRKHEAARAATLIGAESRILDTPDGCLEASLANRFRVIALVRQLRPDLLITNRPNDYHPDHRYTSILVQDSAYMFMVPNVVPDIPPLDYNPVILYWADTFKSPREFQCSVAVDIDPVFEFKLDMLHAHESQLYEWLPWVGRVPEPVPPEPVAKRAWLRYYYGLRNSPPIADRFRGILVARYGSRRGLAVREAEAFELCEYGSRPTPGELERMFSGA
jgi:LmbE family N-acetylglucosaminyl deacetylase